MSSVVISGNTSGTITLDAPAVAGTTTLTLPATSGTIVTTTSGAITSAQLPTGSVIQVVSAVKTDTFSSTTSTYVDITGLSVSITPTNSANKILIFATLNWAASGNDLNAARLLRGATVIAAGDAEGSRTPCFAGMRTANADNIVTDSIVFLDTPATTSATTYKIQAKSGDTNTFFINRTFNDSNAFAFPRAVSSLVLMEIKG